MSDYSTADILNEIERELAMRKRHYPTMIARGALSYQLAEKRINILKQIAKDYRALEPRESLFDAVVTEGELK